MSRDFTIVRYSDISYSNAYSQNYTVKEDNGDDSQKHVRRPLNGLRPNTNYYATIISPNAMINSSYLDANKLTMFNNNFLIQNVTLNREEKMQVIETFGENYVYFFGHRSPTANFRGLLLNSQTFEWFSEFDQNYVNSFRGTRTSARNKEVSITIDGVIYSGHIHNVSYDLNAEMPNSVNVSFNMHIHKIHHITNPRELKGAAPSIIEQLNTDGGGILSTLVFGNETNSAVTRDFASLGDELAFYLAQNDAINVDEINNYPATPQSSVDSVYKNGYRSLFPDEFVNHVSGKAYDDLFDESSVLSDLDFLRTFRVSAKKSIQVLTYEDARKRGSIGTLEPKVYVSAEQRQEMATQSEDVRNKVSGFLDAHVNDSSIFDGLNVKLKQTLTVAAGLALYKGLEAANNLFGRSTQKILDQVNQKADAALGVLR